MSLSIRLQKSLILYVATAGLGWAPSVAAAEIPFGARQTVEASFTDAGFVDAADLDGDGDLDLFGVAESDDDVVWWENTAGDGSAWTRHDLSLDLDLPVQLAAGDLDGDGDVDLVGAGVRADILLWWENDLDSGAACGADFCQHTVDPFADAASEVALEDLDRDGDLDIVCAVRLIGEVVWYENDLDGVTPWTRRTVDGTLGIPVSVATADLDGDGDADVLAGAAGVGDDFGWIENDLDGRGSCAGDWCLHALDNEDTNAVAIADLDGDGDPDMIEGGFETQAMSWWENTAGDGSAWSEHVIPTSFTNTSRITVADLDLDGDIDILPRGNANARWLENTLGDGSSWTEHGFDSSPFQLTAADLDGDGDLDLAGASTHTDSIAWWQNLTLHRSAIYGAPTTIEPAFDDAHALHLVDMDRDGDLDVLGAAKEGGAVSWWENTAGDGTSWTEYSVDSSFPEAAAIFAADLDGDGDPDVIAGSDRNFDEPGVAWWSNDAGDGTAWTQTDLQTGLDDVISVHAGDLDGDGDLDVLATTSDEPQVRWYENDAGDGSSWTEHALGTLIHADGVHAVDVDGNGVLDVVAGTRGLIKIVWFQNIAGDGSTWTRHPVGMGLSLVALHPADLDGDGDPDLVAGTDRANKGVAWFENSAGDGSSWSEHVIEDGDLVVSSVFAADLDLDGDLDVAGTLNNLDDLVWWENTAGDASAWSRITVDDSFAGAVAVAVGDVDGDGLQDLVAAGESSDTVAWWPNRGGQLALPTLDAAIFDTPAPGTTDQALLNIVGTHRGRPGDADAELATLELLFEEMAGDPLTGAELDGLIDTLRLYLDNGDDVFAPQDGDMAFFALGSPFTLDAGVLTVTLVDGDPNVQIAHGTDKVWWLAADISAEAASADPETFRVSHLTSSSSSGEMATTDLPLTLELQADVATRILRINDPPTVDSPIPDQTADTGVTFLLDVSGHFSDEETADLVHGASGLPDFLSISTDGAISGMPRLADVAGSPYTVTVTATDAGGLTAEDTFELTVSLLTGTIIVDGVCSLTDAILSANANSNIGDCFGAGGVETIRLDVDVTLAAADPLNSSVLGDTLAGLPDVTSEMVIRAGAAALIERDASLTCEVDNLDPFRLLNVVSGGRLVLEDLILRGGCARQGGAVFVAAAAELEVSGGRFEDNVAAAHGAGGFVRGGAIYVALAADTLTVSGATFQDNRATAAGFSQSASGGAIAVAATPEQPATIVDSDFVGNSAISGTGLDANGGAIFAAMQQTLGRVEGCEFTQNQALGGAGSSGGGSGLGGAISSWDLTILAGSIFTDNLAQGGEAASGFGGHGVGGAVFNPAGFSEWSDLVFTGNQAIGGDSTTGTGGIGLGGATHAGAVGLTHGRWSGNSARGGDGVTGGDAVGGGALLTGGSILESATLSGNSSRAGDGTTGDGGSASGGGLRIFNSDASQVTLSDNEARGGDSTGGGSGGMALGGGVEGRGVVELHHLTVTGNRALAGTGGGSEGGGLWTAMTSVHQISNTILAGNTRSDGGGAPLAEDCDTTTPIGSLGYNLVQNPGNCVFAEVGDQTGFDPLVIPLAEVGCTAALPDGSCLPVHALPLGSPALDQGSCTTGGVVADIRGFARPFDHPVTTNADDGCDIGAFELIDADGDGIDDAVDPEITVAPVEIDFGYQLSGGGPGAPRTLTITNDGSADLSISDVSIIGADASEFAIVSDTGESVLAPATGRVLTLTFSPTVDGIRMAALRIESDDPDEPTVDVGLQGIGFDPSELVFADGFESGDLTSWSASSP